MIAAVVTGVILSGPAGESAAPSTSASAPPVVAATVPTPELNGTPSAEGGILTVPVANPDAEAGDVFVWRVSNRGESEGLRPADGTVITVDGFDGSLLCVEVFVLRAGKTSPAPLEVCYPA